MVNCELFWLTQMGFRFDFNIFQLPEAFFAFVRASYILIGFCFGYSILIRSHSSRVMFFSSSSIRFQAPNQFSVGVLQFSSCSHCLFKHLVFKWARKTFVFAMHYGLFLYNSIRFVLFRWFCPFIRCSHNMCIFSFFFYPRCKFILQSWKSPNKTGKRSFVQQ